MKIDKKKQVLMDWTDFVLSLTSMGIVYTFFSDAVIHSDYRFGIIFALVVAVADICMLMVRFYKYVVVLLFLTVFRSVIFFDLNQDYY